jgi:hypothetical protein
MNFYKNTKQFYGLVGNNIASSNNLTIDNFLGQLTDKYSNAGLIFNYLKNRGVSGNLQIKTLLSRPEYFSFLDESLVLAGVTDNTDFIQKVIENNSLYTEENKFSLLANDVEAFGYSGRTFSYTTLVESKESAVVKDFSLSGDIVTKSYRLVGNVFLGDSAEYYILPLGLITIEGDYIGAALSFGKNTVSAQDTGFDNVVTPLASGCLVTNTFSGEVQESPVGFILAINTSTVLGPDDYLLFLIIGDYFGFGGFPIGNTSVAIDQEFSISTLTKDFSNVKANFINI